MELRERLLSKLRVYGLEIVIRVCIRRQVLHDPFYKKHLPVYMIANEEEGV